MFIESRVSEFLARFGRVEQREVFLLKDDSTRPNRVRVVFGSGQ